MMRMRQRWRLWLTAVLAVVALVVGVGGSPAAAAPGDPSAPGDSPAVDDEGADRKLREALEATSRGYLEAQAALEASGRRQVELTGQLATAEGRLAVLTTEVAQIAVNAYRVPRVDAAFVLLGSEPSDTLLDRMTTIDVITSQQNRQIQELHAVRGVLADAKAGIDSEVANQQNQVAVMATKKQEAERAVASEATNGHGTGPTATAAPAPRAANGSWPPQSCTVKDPTTSGCITQRTLHAMQQAKKAGFTRNVSCYRSLQDGGEHPKGRACDFGVSGAHAAGADRVYGNNLARYLVRNANRLGVLYVIWYRQIWMPSTGWRAYKGKGDPSSEHTNHVHLSMI